MAWRQTRQMMARAETKHKVVIAHPIVYHNQGTNWLLYSVGTDGVDDGGRPAGRGVNSKGDLFFDSLW